MSGKNCNHLELQLSVWTNPVFKTSWASLPAKQAITVGSSSSFNVKLLQVIGVILIFQSLCHISLMPASCLSLTNAHQDIPQ